MDGFVTRTFLVPQENQGVVLLANLETAGRVIHDLALRIIDILTCDSSRAPPSNEKWLSNLAPLMTEPRSWNSNEKVSNEIRTMAMAYQPEQYAGFYDNPGYGVVQIFSVGPHIFASYNNMHFSLLPKSGPEYFTVRAEFPFSGRYECSFVRDAFNDVRGYFFDLEPKVPAIFFERKVPETLSAIEYLKLFIGIFENVSSIVQIRMNENANLLTASGVLQYSGVLRPHKLNWFRIQRTFLEFVTDSDGSVSELKIHTGEYINVLKKSN